LYFENLGNLWYLCYKSNTTTTVTIRQKQNIFSKLADFTTVSLCSTNNNNNKAMTIWQHPTTSYTCNQFTENWPGEGYAALQKNIYMNLHMKYDADHSSHFENLCETIRTDLHCNIFLIIESTLFF
jgi:hypothetical protein